MKKTLLFFIFIFFIGCGEIEELFKGRYYTLYLNKDKFGYMDTSFNRIHYTGYSDNVRFRSTTAASNNLLTPLQWETFDNLVTLPANTFSGTLEHGEKIIYTKSDGSSVTLDVEWTVDKK